MSYSSAGVQLKNNAKPENSGKQSKFLAFFSRFSPKKLFTREPEADRQIGREIRELGGRIRFAGSMKGLEAIEKDLKKYKDIELSPKNKWKLDSALFKVRERQIYLETHGEVHVHQVASQITGT